MKADLLIVGGGLAGGLIALALARDRPDLSVVLVEAGERLGGNHVWSFFDADVAEEGRALLAPLVCHRWEGYDVRFPGHRRTLGGVYNSIESERLDAVVRAALPAACIRSGIATVALDPDGATLADGTRIDAGGVIDARGSANLDLLELGWQKFAGQLLRLERPHGLVRPVVMDATVDQAEGYRFVYLLPFGPDRLFVEDTYYSDSATLDPDALARRIAAYAAAQGWRIAAIERAEAAALPIAMGGDFEAYWRAGPAGIPKAGMAAALFHPLTGYSLPDAVRTALMIARLPDLSTAALHAVLHRHAADTWRRRGFYRLLARMLFRAADPAERFRIFGRFYRLDEGLIARFYAGASTARDKARILCGKPPVPIGRAIRAIVEGLS